MSTSATDAPTFEAFPSGADPRLPQGEWYADVPVVGDATAGSAAAICEIFASSHTPTGQVFSLENVSVITGALAASNVLVQSIGWDYGGNTSSSAGRTLGNIQLTAYAGGTSMAGYLRDSGSARSLFLGSPINGAAATIEAYFVNTDGIGCTFLCSGKWWVPEARYLAGGPVNEGAVVAPLPLELTRTPYYAALRSGQIAYQDLMALRAAQRPPSVIRAAAPVAKFTPMPVQPFEKPNPGVESRLDREAAIRSVTPAARTTQQVQTQLGSSIAQENRLRVGAGTTTALVQAATAAPIALSALIAKAPAGITIKQYQAFNRASAILADPRFARTES